MGHIDYKKIGFKCGIEIHQQLDTTKLFCRCPSCIREDSPDIQFKRKMRAVAGEIGNVDPAALHEYLKDREIHYQAYSDTTCLVEMDEEPPHDLDQDALRIALETSILLNARPVDELCVMRKTVIDGSNTSGFQRTMMAAMNGYVETPSGKVDITTVCLEEDASRKIKEEGNTVTYSLDRLGIPLVEICTAPQIKNPAHAREVAERLGMILRATGKVKRGLGTIRQDLNVSISKGERIEIKGVQDLKLIEKIIENEVMRQIMLIEVKEELLKRGVRPGDYTPEFHDLTGAFKETTSKLVLNMLKKGSRVIGVNAKGLSGLLKGRLGPQLAQYAKSETEVKGLFHSDELPGYGIVESEVEQIRDILGVSGNDAFILVVEDESVAKKAICCALKRCEIALQGVPEETRRAKPDATTEFMRPLPGSARMYPETDVPDIIITRDLLENIKKDLPEMPEEKLKRYLSIGIGKELANQLLKSRSQGLFESLSKDFPKVRNTLIASTLLSMPKEVKKRYNVDTTALGKEHYTDIFTSITKGEITKEAIPEILAALAKDPKRSVEDIAKTENLMVLSDRELEEITDRLIKENLEFIQKLGSKATGALLGKAMGEVKGRADPATLKAMLERKIG